MKFILEIINEWKKVFFWDFFDFCERMLYKMFLEIVLEVFVFFGCFDEFGEDWVMILVIIDVVL